MGRDIKDSTQTQMNFRVIFKKTETNIKHNTRSKKAKCYKGTK